MKLIAGKSRGVYVGAAPMRKMGRSITMFGDGQEILLLIEFGD